MSRSHKKNPIVGNCICGRKPHKFAKRLMTKKTRNWIKITEEMHDGSMYKRFMYDWYWRPDDGRHWSEDPKAYRK